VIDLTKFQSCVSGVSCVISYMTITQSCDCNAIGHVLSHVLVMWSCDLSCVGYVVM